MRFRDQLLATLRAIQPVLDVEGVMVVGSEIPNLLQPGAASTLVISKDVDVGVPVSEHGLVCAALDGVEGLEPSAHEPSVWLPADDRLIEVNFVGLDPAISSPAQTYVFEDERLPLLVFGPLSRLRPGERRTVEGVRIPLPRVADLIVEKLITDRSGRKGDRDLLVVAGLLAIGGRGELDELVKVARGLEDEELDALRSGLTTLSLLPAMAGMPDPSEQRGLIGALLDRLDEP